MCATEKDPSQQHGNLNCGEPDTCSWEGQFWVFRSLPGGWSPAETRQRPPGALTIRECSGESTEVHGPLRTQARHLEDEQHLSCPKSRVLVDSRDFSQNRPRLKHSLVLLSFPHLSEPSVPVRTHRGGRLVDHNMLSTLLTTEPCDKNYSIRMILGIQMKAAGFENE